MYVCLWCYAPRAECAIKFQCQWHGAAAAAAHTKPSQTARYSFVYSALSVRCVCINKERDTYIYIERASEWERRTDARTYQKLKHHIIIISGGLWRFYVILFSYIDISKHDHMCRIKNRQRKKYWNATTKDKNQIIIPPGVPIYILFIYTDFCIQHTLIHTFLVDIYIYLVRVQRSKNKCDCLWRAEPQLGRSLLHIHAHAQTRDNFPNRLYQHPPSAHSMRFQ